MPQATLLLFQGLKTYSSYNVVPFSRRLLAYDLMTCTLGERCPMAFRLILLYEQLIRLINIWWSDRLTCGPPIPVRVLHELVQNALCLRKLLNIRLVDRVGQSKIRPKFHDPISLFLSSFVLAGKRRNFDADVGLDQKTCFGKKPISTSFHFRWWN